MKYILGLILISFLSSCAIREISYDRDKLLKRYSDKFSIMLDGELIDLKTIYLDENNIESIFLNKEQNEIKILQNNRPQYLKLQLLNLDLYSSEYKNSNKENITLIVLNGAPLSQEYINKVKIDVNMIKELKIIKKEILNKNPNLHHSVDGDILIINTN